MTDFVLTPDPREAKLPVWARELLQSYRSTITDLSGTIASLQGANAGSNVTLIGRTNQQDIPLPKHSRVAFTSNWGKIQVGHDLNGRVNIQGDNILLVRINAGNNLSVELED